MFLVPFYLNAASSSVLMYLFPRLLGSFAALVLFYYQINFISTDSVLILSLFLMIEPVKVKVIIIHSEIKFVSIYTW
jgi:hypothetical protein